MSWLSRIFLVALATFWGAQAHAQSPPGGAFDPSQFHCSSGPATYVLPLHMVTFAAEEARYCKWDLDKLTFESTGQPIRATQEIDNFIIYQDVEPNPLTHCGRMCQAPFAVVADPRHPVTEGQLIAAGTYRIARVARFQKDSGGPIVLPVVELVPPPRN